MACDNDNDELEINPFYKALQDKFLRVFETAQQHCYWICVPQSDSINLKNLDTIFAETHVLQPSALFKGHFENLCTTKVKRLHLTDDGKHFVVDINNGRGRGEKIKILSEELAYNKDLKPYKILVIEKPLHPFFEAQHKEKDQLAKYFHTPKLNVKECSDFLQSFCEAKWNMSELNGSIEYFNRHYMVLEDYLDDAARRIGEICNQAFINIMKTLKRPLSQDTKFQGILTGAIESYVTNAFYPKIFPIIRQRMKKENKVMMLKCDKLNKVKPEQIGVRKEFSCPLPSAIVELANLGSLQTPREKLICLKATVDNTAQGVTTFVKESQLVGITLESGPVITSDDLIPILVMVIAQAKCSYLPSDLFYIDNFMWEAGDRDRDNLSYCLVSFKAAVQYMLSTDFSHLAEKKSSHEKEISIEELMKKKSQSDSSSYRRHSQPSSMLSSSSSSSNPQAGRLEKQLSRISNLLEKASLEEINGAQESKDKLRSNFPDRIMRDPTPDVIPDRERREMDSANPLGDFLTSLQKDAFDQPFGKQS